MRYCLSIILLALACIFSYSTVNAQENNKTENDQPVILYNGTPKKYEIADIKVTDIENYEDYVLIGISGLAVGQTITVPVMTLPVLSNATGVTGYSLMLKSQQKK